MKKFGTLNLTIVDIRTKIWTVQIQLHVGFFSNSKFFSTTQSIVDTEELIFGSQLQITYISILSCVERKKALSHGIVSRLTVFLLFCFYAGATQCWLLQLCNKVWNQKVWCLLFFLSFSKSFWDFRVSIDSIWILVFFFLFLWKISGILIRSMLNLQMFWGWYKINKMNSSMNMMFFNILRSSVSFSLIIFNVQIFHLPGYIYSSVFILFNAIKNWIILIWWTLLYIKMQQSFVHLFCILQITEFIYLC